MDVEETLDTGGVYACGEVPIGPATTAAELRAELVERRHAACSSTSLARPLPEPQPQLGEATYAEKIAPGELELEWARPAVELDRVVRVGGAWTTFRGRRLKVHRGRARRATPASPASSAPTGRSPPAPARCGSSTVQPEGKGADAVD